MIHFILLFLMGTSPLDLENAGRLAEAGAGWQREGSLQGQVRIMGRFLEEALYAGEGERALLLIQELESVCSDTALVRYWRARVAWSAGMPELAAAELDRVVTDDQWLLHRAAGTAALYRGQGTEAVSEFLLATAAAGTSRRQFWSGLDLCSAYLSEGMTHEALALSELLLYNYTGDAMAEVMNGLCLHVSGYYSRAAGVLSGVSGESPAAKRLAYILMEGFEQ
jgi:hypothetical protein